jgi:hypothetical protein
MILELWVFTIKKTANMYHLEQAQSFSQSTLHFLNLYFNSEVFHSVQCFTLDIFSITPTQRTLFVYYTSIPFFSYVFRCISHHLQGELSVPYSQTPAVFNQPRQRNITKTGHGVFLRTLHPTDPRII